ncbi:MAG: hypothetical protein Q4G16_01310 [Cruoricaptor ignavus]|nr:hypothetical protein [Cruoricaptor ignavus]
MKELIKKIWIENEKEPFGANVIAFYFFLLHLWLDNKKQKFELSDYKAAIHLKLARQTINTAKNKLQKRGLIVCSAKRGFATAYKILSDYNLKEEELVLPVKTKTLSPKEQLPIIPKEKKKETVISVEVPQQGIKPSVAEEKVIEKPQSQINGLIIPTVDEFFHFARKQEIYIPSKELDYKIKAKYDDWKSKDWKNNLGRPITNWQVTLRNSLPYMLSTKNNDINLNEIPTIRRPKEAYDE